MEWQMLGRNLLWVAIWVNKHKQGLTISTAAAKQYIVPAERQGPATGAEMQKIWVQLEGYYLLQAENNTIYTLEHAQ